MTTSQIMACVYICLTANVIQKKIISCRFFFKMSDIRKKKDVKKCGVCGDLALGSNFNAITCESCKAFFRRNALKTKVGLFFIWIMLICVYKTVF